MQKRKTAVKKYVYVVERQGTESSRPWQVWEYQAWPSVEAALRHINASLGDAAMEEPVVVDPKLDDNGWRVNVTRASDRVALMCNRGFRIMRISVREEETP